MKIFKNIIVGFLVSFIGSLPLGYLNFIGYDIHEKSGFNALLLFLAGVICVEGLVIYSTLLFAEKLSSKKKLLKTIEIFSIIFMLALAGIFFFSSHSDASGEGDFSKYLRYAPFVTGVLTSGINVMQLPFWTGWNLYLVNGKYISVDKYFKYFYLTGTLFGTFAGMLAVIFGLKLLAEYMGDISKYLTSHIIPILFLGMAIFQMIQFYRKYYRSAKAKN